MLPTADSTVPAVKSSSSSSSTIAAAPSATVIAIQPPPATSTSGTKKDAGSFVHNLLESLKQIGNITATAQLPTLFLGLLNVVEFFTKYAASNVAFMVFGGAEGISALVNIKDTIKNLYDKKVSIEEAIITIESFAKSSASTGAFAFAFGATFAPTLFTTALFSNVIASLLKTAVAVKNNDNKFDIAANATAIAGNASGLIAVSGALGPIARAEALLYAGLGTAANWLQIPRACKTLLTSVKGMHFFCNNKATATLSTDNPSLNTDEERQRLLAPKN
jgi:hypothetical protein